MRNLMRTVVISGALFVAITAQAQAATTVGQTFVPDNTCSADTGLQSSSPGGQYTVPAPGVITAWSHEAPPANAMAAMKFKVGRAAGEDTFTIIGESPLTNIVPGQLNTFTNVSIPVRAGDVIGIFNATNGALCGRTGDPAYVVHGGAGDIPPGTTTTFVENAPGFHIDISARLEADCDNDGLGDETQDTDTTSCACQGTTIATTNGTEGDDNLVGTANADAIFGLGGNDELDGVDGDDCLDGGEGDDRASGGADDDLVKGGDGRDKVRGLGGKDRLKGQGGVDRVNGGEGSDKLSGGPGADKLRGGAAKDKYKGNAGNDALNAVDAKRDRVNCGGGDDKAVVDPVDRVSRNCETVREVEKED